MAESREYLKCNIQEMLDIIWQGQYKVTVQDLLKPEFVQDLFFDIAQEYNNLLIKSMPKRFHDQLIRWNAYDENTNREVYTLARLKKMFEVYGLSFADNLTLFDFYNPTDRAIFNIKVALHLLILFRKSANTGKGGLDSTFNYLDKLEQMKNKLENKYAEYGKIKEMLEYHEDQLQKLEQRKVDCDLKRERDNEYLQELQDMIDQQEKKISNHEKKLKKLEMKEQELKEEIVDPNDYIQMKEMCSKLNNEKFSLDSDCKQLHKIVHIKEEDKMNYKRIFHLEKIDMLTLDINSVYNSKADLAQKPSELNSLTQDVKNIIKNNKDLEEEIITLEGNIREEVAKCSKEIDNYENTLDECKKIFELELNSDLSTDLEELVDECTRDQKKIDVLSENINEVKEIRKKITDKILDFDI